MLLRALPNEVCKLFLACGHLHNITRNGLSPRSPLKSEEVMSQGRMKQVLSQKTRGHQGKQFKTVFEARRGRADAAWAMWSIGPRETRWTCQSHGSCFSAGVQG